MSRLAPPVALRAHAGQTVVEYAMLLALLVVIAVGALGTLGGGLDTAWNGTMKPKMTSPEAPKVLAQQSAPNFSSTADAGEAVSYDISGGATAGWDGTKLGGSAASFGDGCIKDALPGEIGYCEH